MKSIGFTYRIPRYITDRQNYIGFTYKSPITYIYLQCENHKKTFSFNLQCILMPLMLVIPWIFNLVIMYLELLQLHVHGVSKSINIPVITKIWLRKIIIVRTSNLYNSIMLNYIFFSEVDVPSIILAVVALTTFKHLTINLLQV